MRRRLALLLAVCAAVSACGMQGGRDFSIGFRREAIDLAYQDEELAAPPTRQDVLVPQPVPSQAAFVTQVPLPASLSQPQRLPRAGPECPTATPEAVPNEPATVFVREPAAVGSYRTHNKGTITIQTPVPITFVFPPRGLITVRNITRDSSDDALNGPTEIITYDIYVPGLDGGGTTTTYQVTHSPATVIGTVEQTAGTGKAPRGELSLIRLQVKSSSGAIDFRPQPPVTIMSLRTGQGTSWTSAGIDEEDGTSMVVEGSVTRRAVVDICGELFDTYEVVSNEHIVNLRTGLRSDTSPTDPNVYHVATHHGGLFIHQHINTTTSFPGPSGAPTIVGVAYDQTFDSLQPLEGR